MKLYITKITVPTDTVQVSFDGGNTYNTYDKSTLLSEGIDVPDDIDSFSQISFNVNGGGWPSDIWYEPNKLSNVKAIETKIQKIKLSNDITKIYCNVHDGGVNLENGEKGLYYGFNCFHGIISIKIPSSVTSIDISTFQDFDNLQSINVDEENDYYSSKDGILYNKSKTQLMECPRAKTSVSISSGVTSIGNYAFFLCSKLASINIPNSVTSIGNYAFYNCTGLTSINIPNSVTSIGYDAFYNCTGLTSINIPNGVTSIGIHAFYGCTSLTSISVDEGNNNYSSEDGVLYNKTKTQLITCPRGKTSVTIPNSVTSIGDGAFNYCTSLTSIEISSGVTSIGLESFYGCTELTSINIPSSVTSISQGAFWGCTRLTSINIPSSITSIPYATFRGCTSLATINYTGTQAQWKAITKGNYWNDKCPSNMVINYNYQG